MSVVSDNPYGQYETGSPEEVEEKDLRVLTSLVEELRRRERLAQEKKKEAEDAEAAVRELSDRQIPALMDRVGLETLTTRTGLRVTVRKDLKCSVPKGNMDNVIAWLDKNNYSANIKRQVAVAFNRGQEEQARQLMAQLQAEFPDVKEEQRIETATLKRIIRQALAEGRDLPMSMFGAYEFRRAKVETK